MEQTVKVDNLKQSKKSANKTNAFIKNIKKITNSKQLIKKKIKNFQNGIEQLQNKITKITKKKISEEKENLKIVTILQLKKRIPVTAITKFGERMGVLSYRFNTLRRNNALLQLKEAFPDWSSSKIQQTALKSFQSIGKTISETIKKDQYSKSVDKWIINENQSVINEAIKTGGIIINGHFANWEFGTYSFELAKIKGIMIGKEENKSTKWFVKNFRIAKGWETVATTSPSLPLKIVRTLKNNKFIKILIDTNIKSNTTYCTFFSRKVKISVSIARLAIKYKKPVISCFNHRDANGRHIFSYNFVSKPPYGNDVDEDKLTQIYITAFEKHIRRYPEQWIWAEPHYYTI